ncbi:MAG: hypothetical protein K1Y02_18040 [Candidatus Hydrogenedentes bacterium]|nr:hypothetical protein [Candidatus Hydrogenedentota bacterium]
MISASYLLTVLALSSNAFDVQTVPAEEAKPYLFYAQGDAQANAAVCALTGNTLVIYSRSGDAKTLALPDGVGAFDIAPLEDGGAPRLVCLRGSQVFAIPLDAASAQRIEPVPLFEIEKPVPGISARPFPHVMVVMDEGRRGIMVPVQGAEEFRGTSGELLKTYPSAQIEDADDAGVRVFASLRGLTRLSPGELAYQISGMGPIGSGLPENLTAERSEGGHHTYIYEPEFPLSRTDVTLRVGYDYHPATWDTLLKMPMVVPKGNAPLAVDEQEKKGPARRYPGTLMVDPEYSPDFNGDGYTDLLLWSSPKPGISIDSLIRTAVGNTWPVRITIHLYSPDKKRFEPAPMTSITLQIPVFWFVDVGKGHPFPLWLARDFDGDTKTDLLLPASDSSLSVWLAVDGFKAAPSDTLSFLEPLQGIVASSETDAKGRTGLVIQGQNRLFILWPKQ